MNDSIFSIFSSTLNVATLESRFEHSDNVVDEDVKAERDRITDISFSTSSDSHAVVCKVNDCVMGTCIKKQLLTEVEVTSGAYFSTCLA